MGRKLQYYQYKPYDGSEIERHTIKSLARLADMLGVTDYEFEKIINAPIMEVIFIKEIGEFRRLQ